jgi:hypothetical protein
MGECEICRSRVTKTENDWAVPGRECPRCGEFRFEAVSGLSLSVLCRFPRPVRLFGPFAPVCRAHVDPLI